MGTDNLGRDEWSRMLFGGRVSLAASLSAAALAVILGTAAALMAQGMGGAADATVVGGANAALAIPGLLISLAVVAVLGPGIEAVVLAVGLGLTPGFARLARQALAQVRSEPYIAAAGALGADGMDTARRHMLPNALPRLLSLATTHYAWAFAGITTLSFLGLSGSASRPEWGTMLNAARPYLRDAAWLALFPGGAIVATILSVHTIGTWLARRVTPGG
jgi:ABC-type dipeptide/oligopeptide/nickel transport system permease subunit